MNRFAATACQLLVIASLAATSESIAEEADGLSIDAQPLAAALREFSEHTGLQIGYAAELAEGKESNGIEDLDDPDVALDALLTSTGLEHRFINDSTVIIHAIDAATTGTGGDSDPKNSSLAPALMAQVTKGQTRTPTASPSDDGVTGAVTGQVTDARTGANLKGALVIIEETGQTTSTDELGQFRFAAVARGTYTVAVSYLGYAAQSATTSVSGQTVQRDFALRGGSELEEIVVFGTRSARAQALNLERTAQNVSTVISADLLGDFTGTTISESLRRVAGVAFERDSSTGGGTNIIIRGLDPDLNAIKLNGIELPETSGRDRSASLANILTDSIESVTIHKTLLPSQDSAGTGGLIEIETKTPLDRPRRFASFSIEGGLSDDDFYDDFLASGTVSGRFGAEDQFGLSTSLQYREGDNVRLGYNASLNYGDYLPLQVDGTPTITSISRVDPRLAFPFENTPGADTVYLRQMREFYTETNTENFTATVSAAWALQDHTNLRLDFQTAQIDEFSFNRNNSYGGSFSYSLSPVSALDGEQRRALDWRDNFFLSQFYQYSPVRETTTDVYTLRGDTNLGRWGFSYGLRYTDGNSYSQSNIVTIRRVVEPNTLDPAFLHDGLTNADGRIPTLWGVRPPGDDTFPVIQFTEAGFAFFNDPALYAPNGQFTYSQQTGSNTRDAADFSARREFDINWLEYVQLGVDYERSEARSPQLPNRATISVRPDGSGAFSMSSFGLRFDENNLAAIGVDGGFRMVRFDDIQQFVHDLPNDPRVISDDDPNAFRPGTITLLETSPLLEGVAAENTLETETAFYIQSQVNIGRLELTGGVRVSRYDIEATTFDTPSIREIDGFDRDFSQANRQVNVRSATQDVVLPRLLANYRFNDNTVLRAGFYRSIARPQLDLIGDNVRFSLTNFPSASTNNLRRLSVRLGNPDLESAHTDSYDLSFERYFGDVGVIKLGTFYKRIENLIESNTTEDLGAIGIDLQAIGLPDDPRFQRVLTNPEDYLIVGSIPVNNTAPAHIWGIELTAERRFTFLPGIWSNFGVFSNYTYADSSKDQPVNWRSKPVLDEDGNVVDTVEELVVFEDVRFNSQPEHSGTFGLSYSSSQLDANLSYTAQSRRQTGTNISNGLIRFEEAYDTLDFRAEYRFVIAGADWGASIEGLDLLRGTRDAGRLVTEGIDEAGTEKYFTTGDYYGGRQLRLILRVTF